MVAGKCLGIGFVDCMARALMRHISSLSDVVTYALVDIEIVV